MKPVADVVKAERDVAGVILAAGASRRFGRAKQLATFEDESGQEITLIGNALRALRGAACSYRAVVLGAHHGEIAAAIATDTTGVSVITNEAWPEGMSSSIRAAVDWATPLPCAALLFMVCDQPLLTAAHLDNLIASFTDPHRPVASAYSNTLGIPALFPRSHFPSLSSLQGDRGARSLLKQAHSLL